MQRRKILIVEDDTNLRNALAELLTAEGFSVEVASDGKAALRHLKKDGGWLILLDFTLPKVSGQEVLRQLETNRHLFRDNRVILISSLLDRADERSLLSDLVAAVRPKPFHVDELLETISRLSEKR